MFSITNSKDKKKYTNTTHNYHLGFQYYNTVTK